MVWSTDHRKLPSICFVFYNNMEKEEAALVLFSIEKTHALHLTLFLFVLFLSTSQLVRWNFATPNFIYIRVNRAKGQLLGSW